MPAQKRKLSIKACDGRDSQKRRWIPTAAWDHIKSFVSDEISKGKPQRSIVADLERQGISIELHQLKRLLKEWGIRDRNICKKNRKYIFETERRLKEQGKAVRTWRFKDTNRPIKQTQLDMIRRSNGEEFEGVEASPGALSPAEIMEEDPPISPPEVDIPSNGPSSEEFQFDEAYEYALPESENRIATCTIAAESVIKIQMDAYALGEMRALDNFLLNVERQLFHTEKEVPVLRQPQAWISGPSSEGSEPGLLATNTGESSEAETICGSPAIAAEVCDSEPEQEEIPEILESLCGSFTNSVDWAPAPVIQTKDTPLLYLFDNLQLEEFCGYLGFQSRWSFEQRVTDITRKALEFEVEVEMLEARDNLSRSECEDYVREQMMSGALEFWDNTPVDYSMARWIRNEPLQQFRRDIEGKIRKSFKDDILKEFYAVLGPLWASVGSVTGTLRNLEGKQAFQVFHREQFHGQLVQLPYLLNKYGVTHWSTFSTLQLFNEFCILWYGKSFWRDRPVLRENMDFLITVLSSFKPSKHLLTCWMDLVTGLHNLGDLPATLKVAKEILDKARNILGDRETFTIWVAAKVQLILREMNKNEEAERLGPYIAYCLKGPSDSLRINEFDEINLVLGSDIIEFQMQQKSFAEGAKYARLLGSRLSLYAPGYDSSLESLAGHCNRGVFDCIKARALSEAGDYKGALLGLRESMRKLRVHQWYYQSANAWIARELMELTTEVMTKRGVVRYSEPILKRIAQGLDERGISVEHPIYGRILAAELSTDFQLSLEEDDWSIPRIMCPEISCMM
ncbi:hypothetical protein TWF281_006764 [Arthrobotrys megalospora]